MRMTRSIAEVRWEEMMKNFDILERLRQPPVSLKLRRTRMKWFGKVKRIEEEKQVKRTMWKKMRGTKLRGRPRTMWKDVIKIDLRD